jgi:hypothetical protein
LISLRLIPHLPEHLDHVGDAEFLLAGGLILPERVLLPRGDLVALDGVRLGE